MAAKVYTIYNVGLSIRLRGPFRPRLPEVRILSINASGETSLQVFEAFPCIIQTNKSLKTRMTVEKREKRTMDTLADIPAINEHATFVGLPALFPRPIHRMECSALTL
jgi:hypothetical protein